MPRKPYKPLQKTCFTVGLFLVTILGALAQGTDASITGRVTDTKNEGLPGVTVILKNESTGFTTGGITNANGYYDFNQLPLGGPYVLSATFVGYQERKRTGIYLNQGNRLTLDFTLSESTTELSEVVVTSAAQSFESRVQRLGGSTQISSQEIRRLPILGRDFTNLIALAPTSNGSNLSGQRFSSTGFLVDGANARSNLTSGDIGSGPYTLSVEALREFEVATNIYDVTKGRQGGGVVSAVTRSGTNTFTGSVFTYHRADWLASPFNIQGNRRTQNFSTTQYGFSLGGPIVKDKLHFFTVLDRQQESVPFQIADIRSDADANNLRISRGALDSVITIARQQYGMDPNAPQAGEFGRRTLANNFFLRLDWQINNKHTLTLRNNYTDWNNPTSVNDNSAINLFETWSDFRSRENSTLLSLRSTFNQKVTNELKVQFQQTSRNFRPNSLLPPENIPRAIVRVRSTTPDGRVNSTDVQFGGQRFTPEDNLERQVQLVNTTYLNTRRFTFAFGTDNMLTFLDTYISNEQNGRFFFNSLQDFNNLRASRYAREVPLAGPPTVQQFVLDLSAFAQMEFKPHPHVAAMFGLRWDATSYLTPAAYNPTVERALGLRTDARAADWNNIQPRFQLTWDRGGKNKDVLRIGGGIFTPQIINYAQVNNIQNSGTKVAAIDVTRPTTGTNFVPTPDFPSYRRDPATAPGVLTGVPVVSTINLNDPNFQMPTVFKANVTYNRFVTPWLRFGVNFLAARTINNYVYLDRNLVDQPFFTLDNEANRGVFVPANTITATGLTDNTRGRKTQDVGRTLIFTNGAVLNTLTAVVDAEVRIPAIKGGEPGVFNISYTWNDARDNSSYNGNVANTSTFRPIKSDPRSLTEINYSDNQFRSKIAAYLVSPSFYGFVLSGSFTGVGGTRFSLVVDGDINGDFVGGPGTDNDLAFVFDPNSAETPQNIRESMQRVLDNPNNRAAEHIRNSIGTIADRNGGVNPFAGTFNVRLTKVFRLYKTNKLELMTEVFNFANLLDRNRGGNFNLGNQTLLVPTGFNQTTRRYNYRVNESVGVIQRQGTPYQIQLGVRYSF
jgi:hypothetical protein